MMIDLPKSDLVLRSCYFDRETDYSLKALADSYADCSKSDLNRLGVVAVVLFARKTKPISFDALKAALLDELVA